MHLDTKISIAGQPAIKVRDFLRKAEDGLWNASYAGDYFKISRNDAQALIDELAEKELITQNRIRNDEYWTVTQDGIRFALATATKAILRPNAEKILQAFLERVEQVNKDDYFLYRVTQVAIFGSYLNVQADRINDIDLLVQITPKIRDAEKHWQMSSGQIVEAEKRGRRFSNLTDRLGWAENEVWMLLKSRSRTLSLHPFELHKEFIKDVSHKIIFSNDNY